jgi:hypothetical protein
MYPLITTKERLAIWEKARGLWKGRVPEPIRELKKMRASWAKKRPSLDQVYALDTNAILYYLKDDVHAVPVLRQVFAQNTPIYLTYPA